MASQSFIALNRAQNDPNFALIPIKDSSSIFKYKLFSKTLDPPKENPESIQGYRTVTIKCLYIGCR
jgi:hypothetical protein